LINPTLTQLADEDVPTDEEIQLVVAIHNEIAVCREQGIQDYMKILPGIIPIVVQGYYQGDLIILDLMQRKISWGDANKRRTVLMNEMRAKLQEAGAQLDRELAASHQAELAQRQRAWNALSQWAYQQQVLQQNQQLINRPVITNCSGAGSTIQCTSY
jgi:hypothetical protein